MSLLEKAKERNTKNLYELVGVSEERANELLDIMDELWKPGKKFYNFSSELAQEIDDENEFIMCLILFGGLMGMIK